LRRSSLVLSLLLALAPVPALAETVHLKDGTTLTGKVVEVGDASVTIETEAGKITVEKSAVEAIDYGTPIPAPSPRNAAGKTVAIGALAGWHSFQGTGWGQSEKKIRRGLAGPAWSVEAPWRMHDAWYAVDLVPSAGYYAGRYSAETGYHFEYSTVSLGLGPRLSVRRGPIEAFGELGVGYASSYMYWIPAAGIPANRDSETTLAEHGLIGADARIGRFALITQVELLTANSVTFGSYRTDLGGWLFSAGIQYRIPRP
jgi:hypothetical protein